MTKIKFYDKELEEILNALRDREEFILDQLRELKDLEDPTEGEKKALQTLRFKLAIVLNLQNIIEVKNNDRTEESEDIPNQSDSPIQIDQTDGKI